MNQYVSPSDAAFEFGAPFGTLGEMTFLRTYSRFNRIENGGNGKRETFAETSARWINYNINLDKVSNSFTKGQEAESLARHVAKLGVFPSGRTMYVGGTNAEKRSPQANFNCSFRVIDSFDSFKDIMDLLMVGSGVGFSVEAKYIKNLPGLSGFTLKQQPYSPLPKDLRSEKTAFNYVGDSQRVLLVSVGDSRQGWVDALRGVLQAVSKDSNIHTVHINYDNVRDRGEPLMTFGGRASGPYPLFDLFDMIQQIALQQTTTNYTQEERKDARERGAVLPKLRYHKWTSIQALDLANMIGQCVVVGGVRRSAQIALGDADDKAFATAKSNLYDFNTGKLRKGWRQSSNNSQMYYSKPTRQQITEILEIIKNNGEPAFINAAEAQRRRPNFKGLNPCAEILLDDQGVCNLSTVNWMAYVEEDEGGPWLDYHGVISAFKHATRIGVRQTCVDITLPGWDAVQKRDRLIGVSMTGWMDMLDALSLWEDKQWQADILSQIRQVVSDEAAIYAQELGIPVPLLATTVKPEGTLSKLPTVSSGLHANMDKYYLQRVRIDSSDPLARTLLEQGVPMESLIKDGVQKPMSEADTWVMEFPVMTPAKRSQYDYTAVEMLEQYKMFMTHYVDHNASNTINVKDDEWEAVGDWLNDNWDCFVGISLMRSFDARNAPFPQMPWSLLTQEEYIERRQKMPLAVDMERLTELDRAANLDDILLMEESCENGTCPVR